MPGPVCTPSTAAGARAGTGQGRSVAPCTELVELRAGKLPVLPHHALAIHFLCSVNKKSAAKIKDPGRLLPIKLNKLIFRGMRHSRKELCLKHK